MTQELPTTPRWRCLLHPRWWLTALLLAVCAWPCWRGFAYLAAVSEVKAYASWSTIGPFDLRLTGLGPPGSEATRREDYRRLVLFKGRDLKSIGHLLPRLRPTILEAEECMAVDLDALKGLTSLRDITFRSCPALQNVDGIKGLTGLRMLYLFNCTALQNVDALKGLTGLQTLKIEGCASLRNVDVLKGLTSLQGLTLINCSTLQNVDALRGLTGLRYLALIRCHALQNVDVIKGLTGLERLELIGCTELSTSDLRDIRAAQPDAVIFFPDGTWNTPPP